MKLIWLYLLLLFIIQISGQAAATLSQELPGITVITMQTKVDKEKVARPVRLPHLQHQWLECVACHHSKDLEGQKIDFVYGQDVQTCETCHNSTLVMPKKVATFKRVATNSAWSATTRRTQP